MFEFLYILGKAASMLLLLYGGFLVMTQWLPARVGTAKHLNPALEDELLLLKHIHNDA